MKLHWLPVKARIEFKICLITCKALKFNQPLYIRELLSQPPVEPVKGLQSSDNPYHLCELELSERVISWIALSHMLPQDCTKSCHFH